MVGDFNVGIGTALEKEYRVRKFGSGDRNKSPSAARLSMETGFMRDIHRRWTSQSPNGTHVKLDVFA